MTRSGLIVGILLLQLAASSFGQQRSTATTPQAKKCTDSQAMQAEEHASTLKDWGEVHEAFKRFEHCDDGAIWEGYSDSVMRLLMRDWQHFPTLNQFVRSDANFRGFVLRHIDDLSSKEDLLQVQHNARNKCPAGAENLCKSVDQRASAVLGRP